MKAIYAIALTVLVALGIQSCSDSNTVVSSPLGGRFLYKAYDSTGTKLVEGWFTMIYQDSAHITGEWHFQKVGNPQRIGPQVGDGNLVGGSNQGKVWVELQPQYRDNNVQLIGIISNGRYFGEWIWSSFAGITNRGPFEAVRQ